MGRDQAVGAVVLYKLRERVMSGCYMGKWQIGERLPSIRSIAAAEGVDRKTAAAAYLHLQDEGRVVVHPRSGVYLDAPPVTPPAADPLERLHRQWLTHAYDGARSLGLDTTSIMRFVAAVAEVERIRLPVAECDWAHAEFIAKELRDRLGVRATPCLLEELRPGDPLVVEAPVVVTTPYHSGDVALAVPGLRVVEATLAPEILDELSRRARHKVVVIAATRIQAEKLRRSLEQHVPGAGDRFQVVAAETRSELEEPVQGAGSAFIWPGAPDWVESALPSGLDRFRPEAALSAETLSQVQTAVLFAAIRRVRLRAMSGAETVGA